jgi:hypothetical protein
MSTVCCLPVLPRRQLLPRMAVDRRWHSMPQASRPTAPGAAALPAGSGGGGGRGSTAPATAMGGPAGQQGSYCSKTNCSGQAGAGPAGCRHGSWHGSAPAPTLSQRPSGHTASGFKWPTTGTAAAQWVGGEQPAVVSSMETDQLADRLAGCLAMHAAALTQSTPHHTPPRLCRAPLPGSLPGSPDWKSTQMKSMARSIWGRRSRCCEPAAACRRSEGCGAGGQATRPLSQLHRMMPAPVTPPISRWLASPALPCRVPTCPCCSLASSFSRAIALRSALALCRPAQRWPLSVGG